MQWALFSASFRPLVRTLRSLSLAGHTDSPVLLISEEQPLHRSIASSPIFKTRRPRFRKVRRPRSPGWQVVNFNPGSCIQGQLVHSCHLCRLSDRAPLPCPVVGRIMSPRDAFVQRPGSGKMVCEVAGGNQGAGGREAIG